MMIIDTVNRGSLRLLMVKRMKKNRRKEYGKEEMESHQLSQKKPVLDSFYYTDSKTLIKSIYITMCMRSAESAKHFSNNPILTALSDRDV